MSVSETEFASWLRLLHTPGIGNITALKLLSAFGLPEHIFAASQSALSKLLPARATDALLAPPGAEFLALLEKTLEWCQIPGNSLLTLADPAYPRALLEIPDPPVILYVKGRSVLLETVSIAVVGSRNATAQGVRHAEDFSANLSQAGYCIVSGLAAGIDAAAHLGGLAGMGATVAVIGTGADIVYPASNRALAHRIAAEGCIVSECPLGTPAIASNFPRRNRIISGLSRGVLVVEAAAQSGSLITARTALEQGRDVFAIPGSIHSPLAKGCHQLIKQGAKLVETAQDILDELPTHSVIAHTVQVASADLPSGNAELLAMLGYDPVHIDVLAERSRMTIAELSTLLLELELGGWVESLPGAKYQRIQ
jgi:DNA processing protein